MDTPFKMYHVASMGTTPGNGHRIHTSASALQQIIYKLSCVENTYIIFFGSELLLSSCISYSNGSNFERSNCRCHILELLDMIMQDIRLVKYRFNVMVFMWCRWLHNKFW